MRLLKTNIRSSRTKNKTNIGTTSVISGTLSSTILVSALGIQNCLAVGQAPELNSTHSELESLEPAQESDHVKRDNNCSVPPNSQDVVDVMRSSMHTRLCNSASWVDSKFGKEHPFNGKDFIGKVSLGFREDEVEGFEPRVRVRIKTDLPNVSSRLNAFIGRVEEDSFVSNTEVDGDRVNNVGLRSTNDDESEWLFGLGYRNPNKDSNGFDYSIGAKLSSGLSPYAKASYRHLLKASSSNYWRTEQTTFWRRDEGLGVSSRLDYTHIASDHDILEWDTNVKYTREAEQWEWITSTTWHHEFTKKTGVSSRIYVRGEEKNPVSIPEYGMTFTYVRPFLRDWLFMETGVDLRWEKEEGDSRYENSIRFGFQFEMLLGDYYRSAKY